MVGAYFVVEIASDGTWQVDFRNIGQVRKDLSQASGTRCTVRPDYWRQDCQFCYDEDDFYSEVVRTALYGLGTVQEEAEIDEVVESATSTFGATPPSLNQDCENFSKSGQKIIDSDHRETRNRVYAGSSPEPFDWDIGDVVVIIIGPDEEHPSTYAAVPSAKASPSAGE